MTFVATVPASHCEPHLTPHGVVQVHTEVSVEDGVVVVSTLGPNDDTCRDGEHTAAEARDLAAALLAAADLCDSPGQL